MGSWGIGLLQDDTVLDVIGEFKDYIKETQNIEQATNKLIDNNQYLIADADDGSLFWIALAKCQWEYGALNNKVLEHVKEDFSKENGLALWKDNEKDFIKRKKVISDFIDKIQKPNDKIKKLPKLTIRKPLFEVGDCLSLKVKDDYYGIALVVNSDHTNPEYGSNMIIALKYWSINPPSLNDFHKADFLGLTYGNWKGEFHKAWYSSLGFRNYKNRIQKIGTIDISNIKEINSRSYSSWQYLLHAIELQYTRTK